MQKCCEVAHKNYAIAQIAHLVYAVAIMELLSNYSIYGVAQQLYGIAH